MKFRFNNNLYLLVVLLLVLSNFSGVQGAVQNTASQVINMTSVFLGNTIVYNYFENSFNDSEIAQTRYANGTDTKMYIEVPRNSSILNASFLMTKVDLGIANYDPNYNLYTVSSRNGTDEAIVGGTRGYISLMNVTDGTIIQRIPNSFSNYISDSAFASDGSEALLIASNTLIFVYDAVTRSLTTKDPGGLSYLTGVSYSHDNSYGLITGGATGPTLIYNTSTQSLSTLCTGMSSTRASHLSPTKDEALVIAYPNLYWFNVSCASEGNSCSSCRTNLGNFGATTSTGYISDIAWKPDGTEALAVGPNGLVKKYNDTSKTISNVSINSSSHVRGISYSKSGDNAIITTESGKTFIFNDTCSLTLCELSNNYENNINAVSFINETDALMVGSGRSALKYNPSFNGVNGNNLSILKNGTSGIFYHVAFKPLSSEALIVGDDGQIFSYNLSNGTLAQLSPGISVPFEGVDFNWNGTEALIVGGSGKVLKYNPVDSSFIQLNSSVNFSLGSVSYSNGTNDAIIGGVNSVLLIKNSTCDGTSDLFCQRDTNWLDSQIKVKFNPSGTLALLGQICSNGLYNSTDGTITGGLNDANNGAGGSACVKVHDISWKPDGTEALMVGRISNNDSCKSGGYLAQVTVYNATSGNYSGINSCLYQKGILKSVSYSPDGTEALIGGENGILLRWNATSPDYTNPYNSLTNLSSGTTGTLFGVDYRRDGVSNEAMLVVGDNKQVLLYDGEKILADPEVWMDNTKIWSSSGNYTNTSNAIDFTSSLESYLSGCSEDSNGLCDVPFWVNSSSVRALMMIDSVNITFDYNISKLFSVSSLDWNETNNINSNVTYKGIRNVSSSKIISPVPVSILGYYLDLSKVSCYINDVSYSTLGGQAYCPLINSISKGNLWTESIVGFNGTPAVQNETDLFRDGTDWKKNITLVGYYPNGTEDTLNYLTNITLITTFNDSLILSNDFLKIINGSGETNITPSVISANCNTLNPTYSNFTVESEFWSVCKQDVDGDSNVDYYKVLVPSLSRRNLQLGGSANLPTVSFTNDTTVTGNYNSSENIVANLTSNISNLDTLTVYLFNSTGMVQVNSTSTSSSIYINFFSLAEGIYYLNGTVNDSFGFISNIDTREIILDRTNPVVVFSCSPSSVFSGTDLVTCTCSATDNLDSSVDLVYTENPITSDTGTFSVSCIGTDNAGNSLEKVTSYSVELASSPVKKSSGGGGSGGDSCNYKNVCSDWGPNECDSSGKQKRTCERVSDSCKSKNFVEEIRSCSYVGRAVSLKEVNVTVSSDLIPKNAMLISSRRVESKNVDEFKCTNKDEGKVIIRRNFLVSRESSEDNYKTEVQLNIENTGDSIVKDLEIKDFIPQSVLDDSSLSFSQDPKRFERGKAVYDIKDLKQGGIKTVSYSIIGNKNSENLESPKPTTKSEIKVNNVGDKIQLGVILIMVSIFHSGLFSALKKYRRKLG